MEKLVCLPSLELLSPNWLKFILSCVDNFKTVSNYKSKFIINHNGRI